MAQYEEAIFYNPANFQAGENFKLSCFYNRFYVSMQSFSLALSKRVKAFDLGLAMYNFDYGAIEWHPDYPTEDPLTTYSANDFSLIFSSGIKVASSGRIGLNIKYIYENIYTYADYCFALDLAFAYHGSKGGITFGTSNFGSRLTINDEDVNLPARISFGGYYRFNKIVASSDLHYLINNSAIEMGFGIGFPLADIMELNGAVNYRDEFYPGFGLTIKLGDMAIKYGGAIYPHDLGMINTIGMGIEF